MLSNTWSPWSTWSNFVTKANSKLRPLLLMKTRHSKLLSLIKINFPTFLICFLSPIALDLMSLISLKPKLLFHLWKWIIQSWQNKSKKDKAIWLMNIYLMRAATIQHQPEIKRDCCVNSKPTILLIELLRQNNSPLKMISDGTESIWENKKK